MSDDAPSLQRKGRKPDYGNAKLQSKFHIPYFAGFLFQKSAICRLSVPPVPGTENSVPVTKILVPGTETPNRRTEFSVPGTDGAKRRTEKRGRDPDVGLSLSVPQI